MHYKSANLKKLIFIILMLISFCGFSQNKKIDSLKYHLKTKNPNDSVKVQTFYRLAQQYGLFSVDSFSFYTNKALKLSIKTNNYMLPQIYNYKGVAYLFKSKADSSRVYLNKALSIVNESVDKETKAIIYQNLAKSYEGTAEFDKKVDYTIKSIALLNDNPHNQCVSIFNLGAIYAQSNMQNKALGYFKQALNVSKIGKNSTIQSASLMALGNTFLQQKQLDSAKVYLESSLALCKQTNSSRNFYETYKTLGSLYSKMQRFDESKKARLLAKKYAEIFGDELYIMTSIASLAGYYFSVKDYKKSSSQYQEFESYYKRNPRMDIGVVAYKDWAEVEGRLGNIEKSGELLEKYLTIKDSIYSKENRAIIANAETKYESEKKDKEIAEQQLLLANQNLELEQSKSKTRTMSILIVSLLSASILLWFLFQQRQKRIQQQLVAIRREQEVRTLETLMEGEEKERFRIAKELHDGVNGDLSAIKFKLSSLLEMNNSVIKEACAMIDNSCEQVRAISHDLVPPSLKNFNLVEAVEEYCQSMHSIYNLEIHFQQVGDSITLDKKQEANLFRIIQELVSNSIKHAESNEINIQLSYLDNTLQLTVEDDGKGFDPKTLKSDGIGLQNVQSRIDYLNAKMDFVSNEKGTSYTIALNTKKQT